MHPRAGERSSIPAKACAGTQVPGESNSAASKKKRRGPLLDAGTGGPVRRRFFKADPIAFGPASLLNADGPVSGLCSCAPGNGAACIGFPPSREEGPLLGLVSIRPSPEFAYFRGERGLTDPDLARRRRSVVLLAAHRRPSAPDQAPLAPREEKLGLRRAVGSGGRLASTCSRH